MERTGTVGERTLGAEAVDLLSRLLRIDTVNPPGNEGPAQDLIAGILGEAGFECEILEAEPGRPNLIARLPSGSDGPVLAFISHVDTVPANPDEWTFDPWSGDVRNGFVLGRGGQDMKDQVATEVAAAAHLARSGWRPERGELKVIVTADEEMGAHLGAKWLCENHPDKAYADLVINEGGGAMFEYEGRRFYGVAVGEKGIFRFKLRARGRAGHGSVPSLGDNALLRLAPVLTRLNEQPELEPTPAGVAFLSGVLGRPVGENADELAAALDELRAHSPLLAAYLAEPLLRVTLVPTKASASTRDNVIPSVAEALIDTRVPPGLDEEDVRASIAPVLGDLGDHVEIDFDSMTIGNESPLDTELATAIQEWLAETDPEASLVPMVMPGFSDSHWFRKAFDSVVVYGFHPQRDLDLFTAAPLVHGPDERAAVADIELAADFYAWLARRFLGG
jgi:acetylornithine deacetylase/succinyl-diaminopimelate desuccinylase-like protein